MTYNWSMAVFNEIRNDPASGLANLPEATINNLNTIKTIISANPEAYNAYVQGMLVRIGNVYMEAPKFKNPLARFYRSENPMNHLVEELFFEPIHAEGDFNPQGPNPLGRRDNKNVTVAYHRTNYTPYYAISVDRVGMMNAFASWDELDRFWLAKTQSMYTGAEIDEYVAMRKVINDAAASTDPGKQMPSAYVGNIIPKDTASGQSLVQALKYIVGDLGFPNTANQAGVVSMTQPEDLVLLLNKDIIPNLDVYTLASLFHSEQVKLPERFVPIDTFAVNAEAGEDDPNANVIGILTTPTALQFYRTMTTLKTNENGQGLFMNYFYHPWSTFQISPFQPFIVLRRGEEP